MSELTFQTILDGTGLHRQSGFGIEFSFPSALCKSFTTKCGYSGVDASRLLSDLCVDAKVNLGKLSVETVGMYGEKYEMPSGKAYGALECTFYIDNNGDVLKLLNAWLEQAHNTQKRYVGYYEDYAGSIDVFLNRQGNNYKILHTHYEGVFLKEITVVSVSSENSQPTQFQASFGFRRSWIVDDTTVGRKILGTVNKYKAMYNSLSSGSRLSNSIFENVKNIFF